MRKSLMVTLLSMLCSAQAVWAQEAPVVRVDPDATRASQWDAPPPADKPARGESRTTAPAATATVSPFEKTETVPVAQWDGAQLTNTEVSATLVTRRPSNIRVTDPEQFAHLGHPQQVETVKQLAYEQILLQQARAAGINEQTPEVAAAIKDQEEQILNRLYYTEKVMPEIQKVADQAGLEYYEKHKDTKYTRPGHDVIRILHVSTYEETIAQEGETLEDVARRVNGSADVAPHIQSAAPPHYTRTPAPALEDKVLSSPLTAGERLLVPMNADKVSSATALAESLRQQLSGGKSIDELAVTHDSDFKVSATQPLKITDELPYFDELKAAAKTLSAATTLSQIVKTPAGVDMLVLQDSTTTQVIPFEDVKPYVMQEVEQDENYRRETVEKVREKTLDELWKTYNVKVNEEAINRPNYLGTDPLSTTTVIAEADGVQYTLAQYLQDLRLTGKDWGQLTRQERMDILRIAPGLNAYLAVKAARAAGLDQSEEYKQFARSIADSEIVAQYLKTQAKPEKNRVSDEQLRAYYTDNIDKYTSPAQVTLREITKRINLTLPPAQKQQEVEKAKKELEEIRSRIKSQEDFAQLARRESESISTRSRGGIIGTVADNYRGETFKNQIRQLKPGEISEPFLFGSEVLLLRLDDRVAPTVQPFETVRRQVMLDYARSVPRNQRDQERTRTLEKANFKLLF